MGGNSKSGTATNRLNVGSRKSPSGGMGRVFPTNDPSQQGWYDQQGGETDAEYDARIAAGRDFRSKQREVEDQAKASASKTTLAYDRKNRPHVLHQEVTQMVQTMIGAWDWQGMKPEQVGRSGLMPEITTFLKTHTTSTDNRAYRESPTTSNVKDSYWEKYEVREAPYGDGTSRYMLSFRGR